MTLPTSLLPLVQAAITFLQDLEVQLRGEDGGVVDSPASESESSTPIPAPEPEPEPEPNTPPTHAGFAHVPEWGYTLQEREGGHYSLTTRTRRWFLFRTQGQWFAFHSDDDLGLSYYYGPVGDEPFGMYTSLLINGVRPDYTLTVNPAYYNADSSSSSSSSGN